MCDPNNGEIIVGELERHLRSAEHFGACKRKSPIVYEQYLQGIAHSGKDRNIPTYDSPVLNSLRSSDLLMYIKNLN